MTPNAATPPRDGASGQAPIRIGIVGANAERVWALTAHLPSIRQLGSQVELVAVSARTDELAERARSVFGARLAFGNSLDLVRSPLIDLVVVTVKVPEHRPIVLTALETGKNVFCEWPLGRDVAEAEEMAAAVPEGCHTMIGLQGLSLPAVRKAQALIAKGALGQLKAMRVFSPSGAWGDAAPPFYAYLQDRKNGASLEMVPGGHTLALIEALAGPYAEVDARNSTLCKQVRVIGTDEVVERRCADHMLVLGLHRSGCVSTLEIAGGMTAPFALTLEGEKGWIRLSGAARGPAPSDYQAGALLLETSWAGYVPVNTTVEGLQGSASNVAESYGRLLHDLRTGEYTVPDFQTALRLTKLIEAIEQASLSGRQVIPAD